MTYTAARTFTEIDDHVANARKVVSSSGGHFKIPSTFKVVTTKRRMATDAARPL
jgi:hypothetical protein